MRAISTTVILPVPAMASQAETWLAHKEGRPSFQEHYVRAWVRLNIKIERVSTPSPFLTLRGGHAKNK